MCARRVREAARHGRLEELQALMRHKDSDGSLIGEWVWGDMREDCVQEACFNNQVVVMQWILGTKSMSRKLAHVAFDAAVHGQHDAMVRLLLAAPTVRESVTTGNCDGNILQWCMSLADRGNVALLCTVARALCRKRPHVQDLRGTFVRAAFHFTVFRAWESLRTLWRAAQALREPIVLVDVLAHIRSWYGIDFGCSSEADCSEGSEKLALAQTLWDEEERWSESRQAWVVAAVTVPAPTAVHSTATKSNTISTSTC